MDVSVLFNVWDPPKDRVRQLRFNWTKDFPANTEAELELAFGYMIGLVYMRALLGIDTISVITSYNGPIRTITSDKPNAFPPVVDRLIGSVLPLPYPNEPVNEYLTKVRVKARTMNYFVILSLFTAGQVYQFNNLTFLQGFLSVLAGFQQPITEHIVGIYDRNGVQYNIQ